LSGHVFSGLIGGVWLAWLIYWLLAARDVKPVRQHETLSSRLTYMVPLFLGGITMSLSRAPAPWLNARFLPRGLVVSGIGLAVLVAGLLVTVWARRHLGRNWSGTITVKEEHSLVRGGPYRYVRHPIYSGLILALIGTVIGIGDWRALIGAALIAVSFAIKLSFEERMLAPVFGEQLVRYRAEVPALFPHIFGRHSLRRDQ
jgi:protein-S-isoprenylcysteine O-methyltransferase Ste14